MSKRPTGTTVSADVVNELIHGDVAKHHEPTKPVKSTKAGGRPKKDASTKATSRITLYLTTDEKNKIQAEADRRGVSMVALARMAINDFCSKK